MKISMYPHLSINRVKHPSRLYAVPLFGIVAKIILLIPVFIELAFLNITSFFVMIVGSFYILFAKEYWRWEYDFFLKLMTFTAKISFYFAGLTDEYPGFSLKRANYFSLEIPYPKELNRMFAIPIAGFVVRFLLLIPFSIYRTIIQNGANLAVFVSWIPVLFSTYYPETTYEIFRDSLRLSLASTSYYAGLSDHYPSFSISMNHKKLKVILIIAGALLLLLHPSVFSGNNHSAYQQTMHRNNVRY
ncbi:MAG TPA: hypothetical protein VGT05_04240 [Patescibacteria group bacterium]|nr:hypothetical protein [Patescibacteria group bacterium]